MNSKIFKAFAGIFFLVLLFVSWPQLAQAASDNLQVSVKAILPENQASDVTYYDLRMTPGQQQDLELQLTNSSDQEQTVSLTITNATTNSTGSIDYSLRGEEYERDNTLQIGMSDLVTVPETVTVPANSTVSTQLSVKMPEESFDGMILGAVRVSLPEDEESETADSGSGVSIKNQIAYTVGLKLQETDTEVPAELDLLNVAAGQTSGRNAVLVTLQNNQANVLEDITYSAQVYRDGSDEVLHEANVTGYRFAPNSHFDYVISWEGQRFQAGTYRLRMTADSEATGQHWEWDQTFEITADEAKKLNESAIDLDEDNTLLYIIIGLSILGLVILLIVLLVYLKKRKDRRRREEALRRRKLRERKKRQQIQGKKGPQKKPNSSKKRPPRNDV
ncbi:DUF916 and DUF3324 domain-containing protein [Enterococcus sp. HY326]|uniref:DUF916 and DUF3324 domain-containing protein n=1 Tax=Enterococcus sp. HY326 TaxID=2971265 RepID=UPI00223EA832|nr:DUF916 and DUF3324 domain-containing protein [Enterococcus sp. HY326]